MTTSTVPALPVVRSARADEAAEIAWLAALTFPLACPPGTPVATMAAHVATHLTPQTFATWASSPQHSLLVARASDHSDPAADEGSLLGYALLSVGEPDGTAERDVLRAATGNPGPYAELSKIYVHPDSQGTGAAGALMVAAIEDAGRLGAAAGAPSAPLWLGTNSENGRAQAFYRKHGFAVAGKRTYEVGGVLHDDVVMLRSV